jgi:hypothetical protein
MNDTIESNLRYKIQINADRGWEDMHHDGGGVPGERKEYDNLADAESEVRGQYEGANREDIMDGLQFRAVPVTE